MTAKPPILLNVLHEEQDKNGYLSEPALKRISVEQQVPLSKLYGVASFYLMLRTKPQGKHIIEVCGSPSCILNDGTTLEKFLESELGVSFGATTKDGAFSLYKTSCIGCCDEAPAILVDGTPHTKLTMQRLKVLLDGLRKTKGRKPAKRS